MPHDYITALRLESGLPAEEKLSVLNSSARRLR